MPIDASLHAQMTHFVMREKELQKELLKLQEDLPLWTKRVGLARDHGKEDLARQAQEKLSELQTRESAVRLELETIEMEKDMLRKQHRRPGDSPEVARAEAALEQIRMGGLVDPDRNDIDRELEQLNTSGVSFDFDDSDPPN